MVRKDGVFRLEELRSALTFIFINILSSLTNEKASSDARAATQEYDMRAYVMEDYFNEHYMEKVSLGELARLLHLGEKQTERMIKKIYGMSFKEQLMRVRMKIAIELLNDTSKSISEISEAVGYTSYNGFYFVFKKSTGLTPAEWREAHRCEEGGDGR